MMIRSGTASRAVVTPASPSHGLDQAVGRAAEQVPDDLAVELVVLDVQDGLHAAASFATRTGIEKKNVEPLPGTLSTQIRPPCSSTSFLVIDRPSPVPPKSRLTVGVRLPELLEDAVDLVGGDADPGVGHREEQVLALELRADLHAPLARELERVAGQVHQALRDPLAVAHARGAGRGPPW